MARQRVPKGPDIRDVKPTIVHLDSTLKFNGGTLSNAEINKVWKAMIQAFERAAHECGMGYAWSGAVTCVQPKQMDRFIEKHRLEVEPPPAADAVDPVSRDNSAGPRA